MNKSVKATLLSALVCPGSGHFSLKLYWRGLVFMLPFLSGVYVLLTGVMEILAPIQERIQAYGEMMGPEELEILITQAVVNIADEMRLLYTGLGLIWLLAMADAYWQSRKTNNNPQ